MTIVLSRSNTKIGNIASFSIPSLSTCPGKTSWCSKKCYAKRLEKQYTGVRESYSNNLLASRLSNFARMITIEIKKLPEKITSFRIHVGGDFYSIKYINSWIAIVKANPNMNFYSYTHSWRIPLLVPHLRKLASLPNMSLLASTDIDTIHETIPTGFREAYAGDTSPSKSLIHCPVQTKKVATCDACKLCIGKNISTAIYFETH